MILSYLILAHLLGDFVFQPGKLVKWKLASLWGVFAHATVHFLLLLAIFCPYLFNENAHFILPLAFVAICHFLIDQTKISYDHGHQNKILPFIADQLLHLITIIIAGSYMEKSLQKFDMAQYGIYGNYRVAVFLSLLVFVSSVIEVFFYQQKRQKNPQTKFRPSLRNMAIRVVVFILVYGALLFLAPYL